MTKGERLQAIWLADHEERLLEVAFHKQHPQYSPEEGARLATEFVTENLRLATRIEHSLKASLGLPQDDQEYIPQDAGTGMVRPYWEIQHYLTAEQRTALDEANARTEQLELKLKARDYDQLLETLLDAGLMPDTVMTTGDDGVVQLSKDIITISDLAKATEWFKRAHILPPVPGDEGSTGE